MSERDLARTVERLQAALDAAINSTEHAYDIGVTDTLEAHREGLLDDE